MTLYIGVDFHPYQQTAAFCDFCTGELKVRSLKHSDKEQLRRFYLQFAAPAVIGVEATGGLEWFEKMLSEIGHELVVGNPRLIRRMALTRQKTDTRDAETILDLLLGGQFPTVMRRSRKSREILDLLQYRHGEEADGRRQSDAGGGTKVWSAKVSNQIEACKRAYGEGL